MTEPLHAALTQLLYETDGTADHILEAAPSYGIRITLEADDLGAAWAAAEKALPDGWSLLVGHTTECKWCSGWWATASKRLEEPPYYPQVVSSETGRPRGEHHDATPAAALRALAARMETKS